MRRLGVRILWMSAVAVAGATVQLSAECATPERPPIVVSGALCGTVVHRLGDPLEGGELLLNTLDGRVVATAIADTDGNFEFSRVLAGDYRIDAVGFLRQVRTVRLLKASGNTCTQRIQIRLGNVECLSDSDSGSGIRLRVDAETPVQLVVDGDEWDGEYTNQFDFIDADPGEYRAELRASGYVTKRFTFSVRHFQVRTYHFVLRRAPSR